MAEFGIRSPRFDYLTYCLFFCDAQVIHQSSVSDKLIFINLLYKVTVLIKLKYEIFCNFFFCKATTNHKQ